MTRVTAPFLATLFVATSAAAQTPPPAAASSANPYSTVIQQQAKTVQGLVLKTAEKVPEELYAFKPTDAVRSLGGLLGHIADAQFLICRVANGEGVKMETPNEKKTSKAEIIAALKDSFAFCDTVAQKINDTNGAEPVKMFSMQMNKLGVLAFNNNHTWEHYGNLVTYMRLKNIVPPSSERTQD